jgi:RimJ/RimL family protein N-acetyltransferase
MFKIASANSPESRQAAETIMARVYDENPAYWPHGLSAAHFDGGLYLIREKQSNVPVGFCGWQERVERHPDKRASKDWLKVGYYSIGIEARHRQNGYAKEAVSKLIAMKSASVDVVRALIREGNTPSITLADRLGVEISIKQAAWKFLNV